MTVHNFTMNMNIMDMMLGNETMYWFSSGLDCRTLISVQSHCRIIGYQEHDGTSRGYFDLYRFFNLELAKISACMPESDTFYFRDTPAP